MYHLTPWWYSLVSDTLQPQAPLSMELFRQQYWSWLPFPPPGYLPIPGIKPGSQVSCLADRFFPIVSPGNPHLN